MLKPRGHGGLAKVAPENRFLCNGNPAPFDVCQGCPQARRNPCLDAEWETAGRFPVLYKFWVIPKSPVYSGVDDTSNFRPYRLPLNRHWFVSLFPAPSTHRRSSVCTRVSLVDILSEVPHALSLRNLGLVSQLNILLSNLVYIAKYLSLCVFCTK